MSKTWSKVRLGEVLRRSEETIELWPDAEYCQITVKLWGKGVVLRSIVTGAEVAASRQMVARRGQFILSRIDARNGALGIVPPELDGAVVTNDFPVFNVNENELLGEYLGWMCRTAAFVEECKRASEGTTNRVRLQVDKFLAREVPLPPLSEQQRVVAWIEELAAQIHEARYLKAQIEKEIHSLLLSVFGRITHDSGRMAIDEVAPLVRRPIEIEAFGEYPELGIRSFGKGTFHKPSLSGLDIGTKRLYRMEPGDLVFNNVFAWEGAVAFVGTEDGGRFGSHRFITCVPRTGVVTGNFLRFYFLTKEGLAKLGEASPGGAGRNRTLGLDALAKIEVPVPSFEKQLWFDNLTAEVDAVMRLQAETATELDALLPSVLDKAFRGEL